MNGPAPLAPADPSLLVGIGNGGRGDDGLGWAFLDRLRTDGRYTGAMEYRYQLQIEDAERISREHAVVFIDASVETLPNGFHWRPLASGGAFEFSTHVLTPASVLTLCERLYGRRPHAQLLLIEGRQWGLGEGLSAAAERHLAAALGCF